MLTHLADKLVRSVVVQYHLILNTFDMGIPVITARARATPSPPGIQNFFPRPIDYQDTMKDIKYIDFS